ncbi:MAG: hypothetical protein KME20_11130 [Kaiparowitsia implicata GSE-PSE-MK54-09C]|jgi:hypothetical protein|nr:hypothetical protein [Kaiparowitsia implicata GSE-PSE-MK54-09C]
MHSSFIQPSTQPNAIPILESRRDYAPCHVTLAGSGERSPAIEYNGSYYSFFRVETTQARALQVASRLQQRYQPILTQIPKGYAIWTLEAGAIALPKRLRSTPSVGDESTYRLLMSASQYRSCAVRVPDLNQSLEAIAHQGNYYSRFKTVNTVDDAIAMARRLPTGDMALITKTGPQFSLWIHERDATLA